MNTALKQQAEAIQAKKQEIADIFAKHKAENGEYKDTMTQAVIDDIRNRNTELSDMAKSYEAARELYAIEENASKGMADFNTPVNDLGAPASGHQAKNRKSIGQQLIESEGFKQFNAKSNSGSVTVELPNVDVKTLIETGAGLEPDSPRTNIVVMSPQPRVILPSLIPQGGTTLTSIKFMYESTFTNNAAARAEGAAAGEMALAFTEAIAHVQTVSHYVPITEEQMEDAPQIASLAESRLAFGVEIKTQYYLINGTGVSPQILGFLQHPDKQTVTRGADEPVFDVIMRGMTAIRTSGGTADMAAEPTAFIINPTDWQNIILSRTADGLYILGNPGAPAPERVWGMLPVPAQQMGAGTALMGDFQMFSHISNKKGLTLEYGWINDDFKKFIRGIRAGRRLSLEIYRGAAFCAVGL